MEKHKPFPSWCLEDAAFQSSLLPMTSHIPQMSLQHPRHHPSPHPPSKNLNTPSTLFSRICLGVSTHSWHRFDIRLHNHQVSLVSRRFGAFCHRRGLRRRRPHRRVTPPAVEPCNIIACDWIKNDFACTRSCCEKRPTKRLIPEQGSEEERRSSPPSRPKILLQNGAAARREFDIEV